MTNPPRQRKRPEPTSWLLQVVKGIGCQCICEFSGFVEPNFHAMALPKRSVTLFLEEVASTPEQRLWQHPCRRERSDASYRGNYPLS
jgi:hypothetical protein